MCNEAYYNEIKAITASRRMAAAGYVWRSLWPSGGGGYMKHISASSRLSKYLQSEKNRNAEAQ
jgi:hypothetical protein